MLSALRSRWQIAHSQKLQIWGECQGNAREVARIYLEYFSKNLPPMHETITGALHRFREIGSVTPRFRRHRWERYNVWMIPEEMLAFSHLNPQLRTAEISKTNGYAQQHVWYFLHAHGVHPYHPTLVQAFILWVDYCNFTPIPLRKNRRSFVTLYGQMSQLTQWWHCESVQ